MGGSAFISLNEAAELTGRAKSTISKALKSGKMSYVSQDPQTKQYEIDPAEALRVFPKKRETAESYRVETPRNPTENSILQIKLEAAEQRYLAAESQIEDLRTRLNAESEERRQLSKAMLTGSREASPEKSQRTGFKLFGWKVSRAR